MRTGATAPESPNHREVRRGGTGKAIVPTAAAAPLSSRDRLQPLRDRDLNRFTSDAQLVRLVLLIF